MNVNNVKMKRLSDFVCEICLLCYSVFWQQKQVTDTIILNELYASEKYTKNLLIIVLKQGHVYNCYCKIATITHRPLFLFEEKYELENFFFFFFSLKTPDFFPLFSTVAVT